MQDLASSALREIPRSVLDSKPPTCLAILYIVTSRMLTGTSLHRIAISSGVKLSIVTAQEEEEGLGLPIYGHTIVCLG